MRELHLKKWVLSNGIRCISAMLPNTSLTCIDFWCKAGSSFEQPGEEGIAHFLEHMIFKGSKNNQAGFFDKEIEALGGNSNAATGFDDVHYHVLVPSEFVTRALELLIDLVLNPALRELDYKNELDVVLEEIAQHEDQPEEKCFQSLLETCWANHSYGRPILGLKNSLTKSSPKSMKDFHQRMYNSENICISIAGSIPEGIEYIIEESIRMFQTNNDHKQHKIIKEIPKFKIERKEISIPRLESSRLLIAWHSEAANSQKINLGSEIATSIMAEGRNSRLVNKLREDLQIVEYIDMELTTLEQAGLTIIEAICNEKHLNNVEDVIYSSLDDITNKIIKTNEIKKAKKQVTNSYCFGFETPAQISSGIGNNILWERDEDPLKQLNYINYWNEENLKNEIFSNLKSNKSTSIIARPDKT
tara:strand:+ start:1126 stop:2376 length:1251 start_codon:yes stop_codon:yes gene_type:complete